MSGIRDCGRYRCTTREVPNARWWVFWTGPDGTAHFRLHRPGEFLLPGDSLLCGEACLTRVLAVHMAEEQNRAHQAEMEREILQAMEKQF